MKTTISNLITLIPFLLFGAVSQAQTWGWAKDIPSTGTMEGRGISTDNYRNNYVVTNFSGTATYGSTNLVSSGSYDIALSKMDENGNYLWSIKVCGGTGDDHGTAVVCDPTGTDIYVTGYYYGTATFGSTVLTSAGSSDIFIAKYNNSGALQWAVSAGGTGYEECVDIAWARCPGLCKGSYVYITGTFSGTATFGSTVITSPTGQSVFVARYSNGGSALWVRQGSATYNSVYSSAITADADNNVYITGKFYSTVTFGSLSLTKWDYDQYVLKYNSAGTEQWIRQGGGTVHEEGKDLRVDASGNVYVCGEFQSGSATYGTFTLTGTGSLDICVVKYNSSGTEQWATKGASSNIDRVSGLVLDAANNIFITGTFEGPTLVMGTITLVADASRDGYIARLNPAGAFDMGISPSASPSYSTISPDDISITSLGHIFVAGDFNYGFTFGSTTITTSGPTEAFVAKLKPGDWPFIGGYFLDDQMTNMDVDVAGNVYVTGFIGSTGSSAFVRKINTAGTSQWYYTGTPSGPFGSYAASEAIISDASGNVFIAGTFNSNVLFGSTTLSVPGPSQNGAFMVKYNTSGTQQWALRVAEGQTGNVIVKDLAVDASGNVYMTGGFYGTALFGTGTATVTLTSTGTNEDVFLAKYDNAGVLLWALSAVTGTSREEGLGIVLSGSDIFISGMFGGTATFGSGSVTATASGTTDMFVAKYNSAGVGQAVLSGGSSVGSNEPMYDIAASGGSVYAVGTYQGSITFGGVPLTSSGGFDGLLVKINASAMTVTWTREAKNTSSAQCRSVDVYGGSVCITGHFLGSVTVGDATTPVNLTSAGSDDVFIEKFDPNGVYQWVKQIGGTYDDDVTGVGVDANEHAYAGGNFQTSININGSNYGSAGGYDYYVEKFAFDDGTFARLSASEDDASDVHQTSSKVIVYPNPFTKEATLEVDKSYEGSYTLQIYDISGRIVRIQEGEFGAQIVIERGELEAGIYTWQLTGRNANIDSGKLIIQ